ncbi:MAG: TlpA family protein disulfide reductase [Candidatus Heimdallarchaeota archaeon]
MMKKSIQFIAVTILLSFIVTSAVNIRAANNTLPEEDMSINLIPNGNAGMPWTLKEVMTGQTMSFSSFAGKVILLEFFATWCGPCETFLDELRAVRAQFSTSQLIMISMDTDPANDDIATIKAFVEEQNMDWFIFIDTVGIQSYYEIIQIPSFYLFNSDQKVVYSSQVITSASVIISEVNKNLGGAQTTTNPGGEPIPDFWASNWYWFVIGGVFIIIAVTISVQRIRVVTHNKKVRQEISEEKQRRYNKRYR